MIVLAIIQIYSKFPALAIKLGGENAAAVLSTLMLLSYTKLQRTVVTIMSFTELKCPDGVIHYVWLYDANVKFFRGKHHSWHPGSGISYNTLHFVLSFLPATPGRL